MKYEIVSFALALKDAYICNKINVKERNLVIDEYSIIIRGIRKTFMAIV